ncbi:MAG: UbiD family decarboxylase [Verrucomicrobia bacterium]|nr:UbiD family decarboxylase [Verrucomicrobiota bacterium]MBS0646326.1 UbiD family decarboxylase [Verrucomicrobiota bacterium]
MQGFTNLASFLKELRRIGELVDITEPVDPNLEIAEIHRRVAAADGPALFFHSVKGSSFPVVTNLFGSTRRVDLAFRNRPDQVIAKLVKLATGPFPPKLKSVWHSRHTFNNLRLKRLRKAKVAQCQTQDLTTLPFLKCWPEDGGHFITLPLVYTQPPDGHTPANLGMYRIQRYDAQTCGLHFQIQKGGGFHYHCAEKMGQALPVTIFIGGPPALMLSAITPLPENVCELLLTGILQGSRLELTQGPQPLISECEFALVGQAPPHLRRTEGPFGDHYGYYSLEHDFPIFQLHTCYHKKDAVYPATVVGKPRQEDFYIGEYLQKLLSPIFPMVMPGVKDLWSYGETGFHALSAAVVQERFYRECMTSAFRILGEGQLSLTKFLLVTDQPIDLKNFKAVLTLILERFSPETDLFIFSHLCLDTLDYAGPQLNKGSRGIMLGIGDKKRSLPEQWQGKLPAGTTQARAYCPGCLVIEGEPVQLSDFHPWPLVILVDNLEKTLRSDATFLWTTFTRFDPASDLHSAQPKIVQNHISHQGPLLLDARMKAHYPKEVLPDHITTELVTQKWNRYFPAGQEMGHSDTAHVC